MRISKAFSWAKKNGFRNAQSFVLISLAEKLLDPNNNKVMSHAMNRLINYRRLQLGVEIGQLTDFKVTRGPFTGMNLQQSSGWGRFDLANQLLGLYEENISQYLETFAKQYGFTNLVDLGAGDGYFVIGSLNSQLYKKAVAFEERPDQQAIISANLKANNLDGSLSLLGRAGIDFLSKVQECGLDEISKTVFLIDIEGGEFDILSTENLHRLRFSPVIVEIHNFNDTNKASRDLLIKKSQESHDLLRVKMGARDLDRIPEIAHLNDSDRWLLCSEGRPQEMEWFVLLPKNLRTS
jgi:predicted RNA methylase